MATTPEQTGRDDPRSLFHDVGGLFRQALSIFRAQALSVIIVASAVVIGPALLVAFLEEWVAHHDETAGNVAIAIATAVIAAVLSTVGGTFLAGLLDTLAGHHVHGHPFDGLAHTFRTLPYTRLLCADFLVSVVVVAASAVLVVPGLIAYTLLALVGPVIIIEQRSVRSAMGRSLALVRPAFGLVFLSVTSVTMAEVAAEELLDHAGLTESLAGEITVTFLIGVLAGSLAALVKVCAAYELIARGFGGEGGSN